jgi:hypothetical protein
MGNDIEIRDLDISSTSFLPREIKDIDAVTDIYSLEDEFAKTKKNRNLGLYFSIGLFFLIVIGSAIGFSLYIQEMNKNVEINISEFEDLRLKEVIDSARSHENNLDLLLIKLEILKVDHQKAILKVKQKYYKKEQNLLARELSVKATDRGLNQIRTGEKREIAAVTRSFQVQIDEKANEIEDIKRDLAQKKANEDKTGGTKTVSNVDRLNALKMQELKKSNDSGVVSLREYYENYTRYLTSLYNPKFSSNRIKSIINSSQSIKNKKPVTGFHPIYQQEGIISRGEYQSVKKKSADNQFLLSRMQRIPYKNAVSPALVTVSSMASSIENDYDTMLRRFALVLQYKNSIISNYQNALNHHLSSKAENGYVINAVDKKNIHIQLNEIFQSPVKATAIVFREDDEYIGKIKITKIDRDNTLRARIIGLADNKTIQPFDKILLEIN